MDAAAQKKILGYFIEEAKEHLETLEDGILDLEEVAVDDERVNELFRAAHSVKGGSAMLGYTGIQKTAHRLEDAFKIFKSEKEENGKIVPVDQTLETLFFEGYDVLKGLIEQLATPEGLDVEEADRVYAASETRFVKLQKYLDSLVSGNPLSAEEMSAMGESGPTVKPMAKKATVAEVSFIDQVKAVLREMLELFKQKPTPENRQKLAELCVNLANLEGKEEKWQNLTKICQKAISNPKYPYQILAPVVIQELKRGADLIVLKKSDQIAPSSSLEQLAVASLPQILIPVDPEAAASSLKKVFNKNQLSMLVQHLG